MTSLDSARSGKHRILPRHCKRQPRPTSIAAVKFQSRIIYSACPSRARPSIDPTTRAAISAFRPTAAASAPARPKADLRYLGSKRVLVLVDGVRWVNGSSASGVSGAADLNTVPTAAGRAHRSTRRRRVAHLRLRRHRRRHQHHHAFRLRRLQFRDQSSGVRRGRWLHAGLRLSFGAGGERSRGFYAASYARQDAVFSKDRALSREADLRRTSPVWAAARVRRRGASSSSIRAAMWMAMARRITSMSRSIPA